jgi:L-fucose/D-arabinose isomerase
MQLEGEAGSMIRVGVLSFPDGRKRVHDGLAPYIAEQAGRIKAALEATGEVEVTLAEEIIWHPELARAQSAAIAAGRPDALILNLPVFAFPHLAVLAAQLQSVPLLAIAPINGTLPGLGACRPPATPSGSWAGSATRSGGTSRSRP